MQAHFLLREIDPGEQHLGDLGAPPVEAGLVDEALEHFDAALEPEMVRRAERAAGV